MVYFIPPQPGDGGGMPLPFGVDSDDELIANTETIFSNNSLPHF